jgi:hypothetical protein
MSTTKMVLDTDKLWHSLLIEVKGNSEFVNFPTLFRLYHAIINTLQMLPLDWQIQRKNRDLPIPIERV